MKEDSSSTTAGAACQTPFLRDLNPRAFDSYSPEQERERMYREAKRIRQTQINEFRSQLFRATRFPHSNRDLFGTQAAAAAQTRRIVFILLLLVSWVSYSIWVGTWSLQKLGGMVVVTVVVVVFLRMLGKAPTSSQKLPLYAPSASATITPN